MKSTLKKITNWELWPFKIIYIPFAFVWLYYSIKSGAVWLFSNVNPTLEFSGFEGETKKEMYSQLPRQYYPVTLYVTANQNFEALSRQLEASGIAYPFIAKPEIGTQGILVRKIRNVHELKTYHEHVPVDYLIQDYVDFPLEFSVFHIRYPGEQKGLVTGFILKEYMQVTGDGTSTLWQLIKQHPKAMYRLDEMRAAHADVLDMVLAIGEIYALSFKGNHNRGARFINLHKEIDQQLCDVFDKISLEAGQFYYGRYDIKCTSTQDLKEGRNISILEFNGTGAEPNHIYDCGMSYFNALKEVARHWKHMYNISRINYKKGIPYWTYRKGRKHLDKAFKTYDMLRKYDQQF